MKLRGNNLGERLQKNVLELAADEKKLDSLDKSS